MQYKKVYLEITNNCNLNCSFCIGNKRKPKVMNFHEFQEILKRLKGYTKYLYFHILGEPLLHPNINEFIHYAKKEGFYVNITTNGYFITKIEDNSDIRQINISLHSFKESNTFKLTDYLDSIFKAVDKFTSNKTYVSLRLWVKSEYQKEIIEQINKHYQQDISLEVQNYKINDYLFINNFHEFTWPDLENNFYQETGTCYALKDHIGILVDGTIVPCCLDSMGVISLGNIFENDLKEIIDSKRYQTMLKGFKERKKTEELCKHCGFLNTK